MLSTILSSDGLFPNPVSSFYEWDWAWDEQGASPMQSPTLEPVISGSGSDKSKPDSPNDSPNSGSDEKKRKRMISNRESARRSRMRKQTHLENLRDELNRLKVENRDLTNRVRSVTGHCQLVERENEMLRTELILLGQRLEGIHEILKAKQLQQQLCNSHAWPCNNLYVEQRPYIINQPIR